MLSATQASSYTAAQMLPDDHPLYRALDEAIQAGVASSVLVLIALAIEAAATEGLNSTADAR